MKLYLEFEKAETKEDVVNRLKANGFEVFFNSFGTLMVEIQHLSFGRDGFIQILDDNLNQISIRTSDISDFEVQR